MSCNCKQLKKIEKNMPSLLTPKYEKKGVMKFFNIIKIYSWKLLGKFFVILFILIGIPIVAITLIINYLTHGELFLSLPFLNKNRKKTM